MAHWDDEQFSTKTPPKDIMCAKCKYRLKPVTVGTFTQDRAGYAMCDRYESKPQDILWSRIPCPLFEEE
jgi:hypothetical protein